MQGFFSPNEVGSFKRTSLPQCGICLLHKQCNSPKIPVQGRGRKKILVVGEAPGRTEDEEGKFFVGSSGQFLQRHMEEVGIDLYRDCWITNALICRPPDNATPTDKQIGYCQPNIIQTIKDKQPEIIYLFGAVATKSVLSWIWKDKVDKFSRWTSYIIPDQKTNAWICPTWHPSFIDRGKANDREIRLTLFKQDLQAMSEKVGKGRPWKEIPNWRKEVEQVMDSTKAAKIIKGYFLHSKEPVAFDFENDRNKPDHPDRRIVCCSLSNGERTISFPWLGRAIRAMKRFLVSSIPKYGWNIKYEHRWCKTVLGLDVCNWLHDGMIGAHILDNRNGVTSLKFQSFVQLGMDAYDVPIKPYLESEGGNTPNRIRELPPSKLLIYNGLDSLLTWKLCEMQREEITNAR